MSAVADETHRAATAANAVRALMLLGAMQAATLAVYLAAARGAPGLAEGVALAATLIFPFACAALAAQGLSLRATGSVANVLSQCCLTAVVATTGGLLSPFLPVFVTLPNASFSAVGAVGVARLGLGALLGCTLVAGLDHGDLLPAYGLDPALFGRARVILLVHSVAVMVVVGLGIETSRRRTVKQLALAKERAEAASRAKSEFLAMMSHELRTPLAGLIGALTLAREDSRDARAREDLGIAASSAESLRALLDDILDFSQVEAGRLTLRPEPVLPVTVIRDVVALFTPAARAKGIALTSDFGPGVDLGVEADALRLRQVLSNLIGNALKFTAVGSITVTATVTDGDHARTLRIAVADTGIGMDEGQLARLFEPFVQVHDRQRRAVGGTGLGLVISRAVMREMGGTLELESARDVGTTARLVVSLPPVAAPAPSEPAAPASPATDGRPLRVLVAEDTPILGQIIIALLEREGCTAVLAPDGLAAVQALADGGFDLALMDVNMPVLDGLEATRRIRALGTAAAALPIYGLSAAAFTSDAEEAIHAGMDGYAIKPVRPDELRAILARVRSGHVREPQA